MIDPAKGRRLLRTEKIGGKFSGRVSGPEICASWGLLCRFAPCGYFRNQRMSDEYLKSSQMLSAPNNSDNTPRATAQREAHLPAKGVSILGFSEISVAREAGMKKGDVIIGYGGERNLTTETLSSLAARKGTGGIGIDVVFLRDGLQETLTLPPGSLGISAIDTTIQDRSGLKTASDKVQRIVVVIQRAYLALALLGIVFLLSDLVKSRGVEALLQGCLLTALCGVSYVGLRHRRDWVITLILIISALGILGQVFGILEPANDIRALLDKILRVVILLFYAYQIHFFRKPDVRQLFRDKGYLVF
jgi:hypothetical protein